MHPFRNVDDHSLITFPDSTFQGVIKITSLIAAFCLIIIFTGGYTYFQIFSHIIPGVVAGKTDLSALNTFDAAVRLNKDWNMERQITVGIAINGEIQSAILTPSDLGLSINALKTATAALQIGHYQGYFNNTEQFARSLIYGWKIAPQILYDPVQARIGLEKLAKQLSTPPQEATLQWDGVKLTAIPGIPGFTLDIEAALQTIADNPDQMMIEKVLALTTQIISPKLSDASEAKLAIENWLSTPVTLSAYDPISDETNNWIIPVEMMRSWVKIEDGLTLTLKEELLMNYLSTLSESLGVGRYLDITGDLQSILTGVRQGNLDTMIIQHDPTSYTVQPGETLLRISWKVGIPYWRITQANAGINPDKLNPGQILIIPSKDDLLPLAIIINKRIIISISQQRLWTFESGQVRSEHIISTGIDRSPTQPGVFQVQTHELNAYASVWDLYMPHFLGVYEAWPGFMNGIHGLPTLSNGTRLWESILGKPASFGCIILNLADAEDLYNWAGDGVVVEIKP